MTHLGLAAELERRMNHVVGTYQDEWRTAVEDPEVRKRFVTFINAKLNKQNHPTYSICRGARANLFEKPRLNVHVMRIPVVEA